MSAWEPPAYLPTGQQIRDNRNYDRHAITIAESRPMHRDPGNYTGRHRRQPPRNGHLIHDDGQWLRVTGCGPYEEL